MSTSKAFNTQDAANRRSHMFHPDHVPDLRGSPDTSSTFKVLNAAVPAQRDEWLKIWNTWEDREIFAHPAYLDRFKGEVGRSLCAVYSGAEGSALYPIILNRLDLEFPDIMTRPASDITSPYGYAGPYPIGVPDDLEALSNAFWERFDDWARDARVVSEFVRFGAFPSQQLHYPGTRVQRTNDFIIDLRQSEDEIWHHYKRTVRQNIQKAVREGVTVTIETAPHHYSDFIRIYDSTMDRRHATSFYYFPDEFFEALHQNLGGHFAYFHAWYGGKVISTELVLLSARNVYSYLGGTESEGFPLRANELIKHTIVKWAKVQGKQFLVLGGGREPGDGLERYKSSFAPHGAQPYFTGQRIFDQDVYDHLTRIRCADCCPDKMPDYFPAYRCLEQWLESDSCDRCYAGEETRASQTDHEQSERPVVDIAIYLRIFGG